MGRAALVTGASSGIGAAACKRLVGLGMVVVGCARNVDKIKVVAYFIRRASLGVSDQIRHKPGYSATEGGYNLEISYLGSTVIILFSCRVKPHLICAFVFTFEKRRFDLGLAHTKSLKIILVSLRLAFGFSGSL